MDVLLIYFIAAIVSTRVTSRRIFEHLPEVRHTRELVVNSVSRRIPHIVPYDDDDDDDDDDVADRRRTESSWHTENSLSRFYFCIEVSGVACRLDTLVLRNDVRGTVQSILNTCLEKTAECLWKSRYMRCFRVNCVYVCTMLAAKNGQEQEKTTVPRNHRVRRSDQPQCRAVCQLMVCVGRLADVRNQNFIQCVLNIKVTTSATLTVVQPTTSGVFSTPLTPPVLVTGPPGVNSTTLQSTTPVVGAVSQRPQTVIAGVVTGLVILIIVAGIAILVWVKYQWRRRSRCLISSKAENGRRESQMAYSHLQETRTTGTRPISSRSSVEYNLPDLLETIPHCPPGSDDSQYSHLGDIIKPTSGSGHIYNKPTTTQSENCTTENNYDRLAANETGVCFITVSRDKGGDSDGTNSVYDVLSSYESEGDKILYFTVDSSADVYAEISEVTKRKNSVMKNVYFTLEQTAGSEHDKQQKE
ncbi:uncharacterized protein LOC121369399 isoform X2 [Gigantopelta aegis]|uniref:uncharacterized protein LOC121369399 isoform X2 n=1 Tax=Gigantopelta aegis TaxID=1735272 RepID=UPI001B88D9E2|nr:uncharacterized protein LOC121369399 isoform X2 [Gigantopelta aegis]